MKLSYGNGSTCNLAGSVVIEVRAKSLDTMTGHAVEAAVRDAFAEPLDYPNLASATVPGDTVAISLKYGTPQLVSVFKGTLAALEHAGIEKSAVTVLLANEFTEDTNLQQALHDLAGKDVTFVVHDASVEEQMALLGITEANRSLRLNRVLCDADLVIPIGSIEATDAAGLMFPLFSDHETRGRFNTPSAHESDANRQKLAAEVQECDWMLGVGLGLQVVPGPDGSVAGVFCGTPGGARQAARQSYQSIWSAPVDGRADLVVATIVGDESQQTWENLGRALAVAEELLTPGGAIAICSGIAIRPGASGKRLREAADLGEVERKLLKDEHADSIAALQLCRSLQRGTVYLKSRLPPDVVERFGLAPIASNEELERLVRSYGRCVVLEEAQHLMPSLVT